MIDVETGALTESRLLNFCGNGLPQQSGQTRYITYGLVVKINRLRDKCALDSVFMTMTNTPAKVKQTHGKTRKISSCHEQDEHIPERLP